MIFHAKTNTIKIILGIKVGANIFAGIVIAIKMAMLLISKKSQELLVIAFNRGFISVKPTFVAIIVNTKSSAIRSTNIARIRKSVE